MDFFLHKIEAENFKIPMTVDFDAKINVNDSGHVALFIKPKQ